MSRKYKFRDQDKLYFVSFSVVYWIDVFTRDRYRQELLDSLRYCQEHKGLEVYAWCIMTNHVHLIIGTHGEKMEVILGQMKGFTSKQFKKIIPEYTKESRRKWMFWMMQRAGTKNGNNKDFQFWQQNNHPIELFNTKIMEQKLNYIHQNPVVAGFVEHPEHWLWSSARDYYTTEPGLLKDVILIE